ncbi:MAG: glycosyltransferase family 4 protein [Bacteroidia bacterium]|jgi:glycosyltransferase involved in cell wall biosynthesis|nr:glycosyltransferase family 4 protein [Bacteroidia bacterium]
MTRKKILFIASHRPNRAPNQRFRFEQYFDYLRAQGFDCELSWFISEEDDAYFYRPGHLWRKMKVQLKSIFVRMADLRRARNADIMFVCREALMLRFTWFEKRFFRSGAKVVYDFDDAIWHLDVSEANKSFGWLKRPEKTSDLIALSHLVFAGNNYLAGYARQFNKHILVIPSTINTDACLPKTHVNNGNPVVIGWMGSITTIKHFEFALPALRILKKRFGPRIDFKVVGDASYSNTELGIIGTPWSAEKEAELLHSMDIGLMPLPDDEWTKGKCGLKGLQYMAAGVPAIMSPVGVNTEIIAHGENGYLASGTDEWVEIISQLVESAALRQRIGEAARKTVVERYSVLALREVYVRAFKELCGG